MNKKILFKFLVIMSCVIIVALMVISFVAEFYCNSDSEYKKYIIIAFILLIIEFILLGIIFYLMGTVKLTDKNLKSKRLILKTNTYEEFEKDLFKELKLNKYQDEVKIPNNLNCNIQYLIRKKIESNDIILILRTDELTEEIFNKYLEISLNYIKDKEKCITEDSIFLNRKDVRLIHIVCVDKVNNTLKRLTENNVKQGLGLYNLPVGISFGSSTVYIAPQKGGFFIFRYEELVKMFKSYIQNQIKQELD